MTRAGRPGLPANVHALRGDPSKLGSALLAQHASVAPEVAVPACPGWLSEAARIEWKRITRHLKAAQLVTQLDRAALAAYCHAWSEWSALETRVQELSAERGGLDRALVESTPSGYRQVSALAQARDRAWDRMMRSAREFGLSPAARVRPQAAGEQMTLPGMPADPMAAFLAAGARVG